MDDARDPRPGNGELLSVRGLSAYFHNDCVLHEIDLSLQDHRCVALVGETGSGKTTLARCIAGLHPYKTKGKVTLGGEPVARQARARSRAARRQIQYVFQSPHGSLNPRKTVHQLLSQPLRVLAELDRRQIDGRIADALDMVALDRSLITRYPHQLSGGERQRIAIARALAAEPSALICDEVTSALDVSVQAAIVELLARLQAETGVAMLFITHNLALARTVAQDIAVMKHGRIVEQGRLEPVFRDPQADYTRKLLADTPTIT